MRGVSTHAALFGVLSEGASLDDRSKLARVNNPRRSAAHATRANGWIQANRINRGADGGASQQKSTLRRTRWLWR